MSRLFPVSSSTSANASLVRFWIFWLRIFNVSYKRVGGRAGNIRPLPLHCPVDLNVWHFICQIIADMR